MKKILLIIIIVLLSVTAYAGDNCAVSAEDTIVKINSALTFEDYEGATNFIHVKVGQFAPDGRYIVDYIGADYLQLVGLLTQSDYFNLSRSGQQGVNDVKLYKGLKHIRDFNTKHYKHLKRNGVYKSKSKIANETYTFKKIMGCYKLVDIQ